MTRSQAKAAVESWQTRLAIIVFVIIATVLGTFATVQSDRASAAAHKVTEHVARVAECNAKYNMLSQKSTSARAELNQEQIDATTSVIVNILNAKTHAEGARVVAVFLAAEKRIEREKAKNPVPPPPSVVCR